MKKSTRRGLLSTLTIIALLKVVGGSLLLGSLYEDKPIFFALFWGICLICVCLIVLLALADIRAVRKEFKTRQNELDNQLAEYISEARQEKQKKNN